MQGQLTARQQQVLDVIAAYIREHGYPPSNREIGKAMDIRSPHGVKQHIDRLVAKGFIEREPGKARAIRVKGQ